VKAGTVSTGPFAVTKSADTQTGWLARQQTCHHLPSVVVAITISSVPLVASPRRSKLTPGPRLPLMVSELTIT
jgi:hypothetical protein